MNWNYIAGFFDGEGCVTKEPAAYRYVTTNGKTHRHHYIYPYAEMTQKETGLLEPIAKFLQQQGIASRIYKHNNGHGVYWRLRIRGKDFRVFWKELKPRLLSRRYRSDF